MKKYIGACLVLLAFISVVSLVGCGNELSEVAENSAQPDSARPNQLYPHDESILEIKSGTSTQASNTPVNPQRNAYFGDLHVHTAYSFDAYAFGTTTTPFDAYRYALGEAIPHPSGYSMKLDKPLDFYAVTDHAMFLGVVREAADTNSEISKYEFSKPVHNMNAPDNLGIGTIGARSTTFSKLQFNILAGITDGSVDKKLLDAATTSAWEETVQAAEQYYTPGEFTTFVAYEYTSRTNDRGNLHRNVIFEGADRVPAIPFSRHHSQNPEGLWDWMDTLRELGIESLAIPHNSNGSNGQMFKLEDWAGNPLDDDYAEQRMRNEPLVEITQVKGTSETHPVLSPEDEWSDFEIMPYRVATTLHSEPKGSYVREAYINGLKLESQGVMNPYKFGLVGASDTHVSATSDKEQSFHSKAGVMDGTAMTRGSVPLSFFERLIGNVVAPKMLKEVDGETYLSSSSMETWGASGLAGVWADENTRKSIYSAFRRKETFATTGPRIAVRFFAGYDIDESMLDASDMVSQAYENGVSMGSNLPAHEGQQPSFLITALADPDSARLQRVQVIKGYVKDGKSVERVFDVACSDGLTPNPVSNRCPDNGAQVNLDDCSISDSKGAGQLSTVWQDPEFDPSIEAFYYVRALENPTCRWSSWDAIRAGAKPRADLHKTLQERAWSSPIWYILPPADSVQTSANDR